MENKRKEMYDAGEYPGMTVTDANRIHMLNWRNDYGLTPKELNRLIKQHKLARVVGDSRTMSMIEYRLTDINFHMECSLLIAGKYEEAEKRSF